MFKFWEFFSKSRDKAAASTGENLSQQKYRSFKSLLAANNRALELINDLEHHFYQDKPFTLDHIVSQTEALLAEVFTIVEDLNALSEAKYAELFDVAEKIGVKVLADLVRKKTLEKTSLVLPLERLSAENAAAVGGKAANLGEVLNRAHLPVPPGFAVTAYACWHFLEKNSLEQFVQQQLKGLDVNDTERLVAVSRIIQDRIIAADPPQDLQTAVNDASADLQARFGTRLRLAVRSSATSEDGAASFAGQHTTVLNVAPENVIPAYKEVVASTFNPRAIFYRVRKGYSEQDVIMSVACIAMVDAQVSGVLYTVDPNDHRRAVMLISAVWGLAAHAVEGATAGDFYVVDKNSGNILKQEIARQSTQLRTNPDEGVVERPVPAERMAQPCLGTEQIGRLAEYGGLLEKHYRAALDIEWAIDAGGKLFILQARPLQHASRAPEADSLANAQSAIAHPLPGRTVLLQGGVPACEGTASGLAFVMRSDHRLHHVPEGAIVVVRETSPRYVPLMGRIQAMITDVGSVTGHMASVAREFRIPTLVGTGSGTSTITHGAEITVDAGHAIVYAGRVEALLARKPAINPMKDSPIYKAVQTAVQRIAPLNLIDPKKGNFTPQGCQTVHDIIRFAHEMAMQAMFRISDAVQRERSIAIPLRIQLPVNVLIIDLGGGLRPDLAAKEARRQDVTCIPLNALLDGMTHKAVEWNHDVGVSWSGFAAIMAQSMVHDPLQEGRLGGPSYVLISHHYMNLNSRLGYHFATIDTYCGPVINDNYLTFHFKGGAADIGRRARRAMLLAEILKRLGFKVEQKMDLVRGQMKKYAMDQIVGTLDMLGRLLGAVRLLDMVLADDRQVQWYVEEFFKGNYTFTPPSTSNSPSSVGPVAN
jgi:pyruvate, water dikinase